jgi:L-fuconolactonase
VPKGPIIDSHVHLYDTQSVSYGWMAHVPALNHRSLMAEFDAAREAVPVDALVFVEVDADPGHHLTEARFIAALAQNEPRIQGIVAHAPVHLGADVARDLEALAAMPLVKSIRRLIQQEADPSVILSSHFVEGLRLLSRYGLSFDLCIKHWQLTYAIELIKRCPNVSFILDHCAKPDIRNGLFEPWAAQMKDLARLPNVVSKLSGVVTEADHTHWTPAEVAPYIDHVINVFGFDRLMFGSDWTVCTLAVPYRTWVDVVDTHLAHASDDEQHKFWRGTARRVYRLP